MNEKELRDKFGEVFTGDELIIKMINEIPHDVMSNVNSRFIENSCGCGNFVHWLVHSLMDHLKMSIVDPAERKRHIVERMIHFTDIQEKNVIATMYFSHQKQKKMRND